MLPIRNITYTKCYLYKMLPIRNVTYTKCYLDEMLLYENVLYEMLLILLCNNLEFFFKTLICSLYFVGKFCIWYCTSFYSSPRCLKYMKITILKYSVCLKLFNFLWKLVDIGTYFENTEPVNNLAELEFDGAIKSLVHRQYVHQNTGFETFLTPLLAYVC